MPFNPPDEVARYQALPDTYLATENFDGPCQWDLTPCDRPRSRWLIIRNRRLRIMCYGHGLLWLRREEKQQQAA
jgi:hypothetical protein